MLVRSSSRLLDVLQHMPWVSWTATTSRPGACCPSSSSLPPRQMLPDCACSTAPQPTASYGPSLTTWRPAVSKSTPAQAPGTSPDDCCMFLNEQWHGYLLQGSELDGTASWQLLHFAFASLPTCHQLGAKHDGIAICLHDGIAICLHV